MPLGEFIKSFIAPNTLIRLWEPISKDDPEYENCDCKVYTVNGKDVSMSWELEKDPIISTIPVKHITDILTEDSYTEAVNIVLDLHRI